MSRRAGLWRRPRFTFWLTFFQSCMLPLFFSRLLSYLVGIKRRTSRCATCKRSNSHFVRYVLFSPDVRGLPSKVYLLVNLFFKVVLPLFFSGLLSYLVGMNRRTSRCVTCKRDNSHFVMYLSPLTSEVYLLVILYTKLHVTFILNWIAFIFGRDDEDQ